MSSFDRDTRGGDIATDETDRLIASNKVESTPVYGRDGGKLGHIHNLMIDKRVGQVEYAVLSFGGVLGLGESYHPLPWNALSYDTGKGGYVVNIDKTQLQGGPSFGASDAPAFTRDYSRKIDDYYGLNPAY